MRTIYPIVSIVIIIMSLPKYISIAWNCSSRSCPPTLRNFCNGREALYATNTNNIHILDIQIISRIHPNTYRTQTTN